MAFSTNRDLAQNRGARADDAPFFTNRFLNLPIVLGLQPATRGGGAWVRVINERDAVADKHVIFDIYSFADEGVAGNLAIASNSRVLLDLDECRPILVSSPDLASVQINEWGEFDVLNRVLTDGRDAIQISSQTHRLTPVANRSFSSFPGFGRHPGLLLRH